MISDPQYSGDAPTVYKLKPYGNQRVQYVEYLLKRLTDFRRAGQSYGQKTGGITIHVTRKIIASQLGYPLNDETRFDATCEFIQAKIDATILGKQNAAKGRPSYHSFADHGQTKVKPILQNISSALGSSEGKPLPATRHESRGSELPAPRMIFNGSGSSDRLEPVTPQPLEANDLTAIAPSIPTISAAKTESNWRATLDAYNALVAREPGISYPAAATQLGCSVPTLYRIVNVYAKRNLQPALANCGRKAPVLPTEDELACVKEIFIKLDESEARGRGLGSSKVTAYRLAAKSEDPRIGDTFRAVVLQRNRKTVPPSWQRLLEAPANVIARSRDARTTMAHYVTTPRGRTYIDEAGAEIPLRAGTITEADDGTVNGYATIPWPFGGDRCSDKYGVRLGRWQLLAAVDARWEMCPSFDIVCRNLGQYRGEDSAALLGRTMAEECMPELWRLERGSWESKAVRGALDLCGQRVQNAWHSKQKSAVERFFDRLWTPLSLIPGHVGRDRGRYKQTTDLALACQDGRIDPREHFLTLDDFTNRVIGAIQFINSEPIESRSGWGRWIPQERYEAQMREQPATKLPEHFKVFFAREQRVWTVRGCVVGGNVSGPLINFPIYFQDAALWEFEGCKVKCYFDPYTSEVTGTLVLQDAWRDYKAGHIIARDVPALELPPQFVLAADGWAGAEDQQRQLAVRKAVSKAVRTEMWNYRGGRRTESRDGFGNSATRTGQPAAAPQLQPSRSEAAPTMQTPARDNQQPATSNQQRRGLLAPQTPEQISRQTDRFERLARRQSELAEQRET